jgi:hypothetical protein
MSVELRQQVCHRCGKAWWPRRPKKPARCPGCKSPYWDSPRRLKHAIMPVKEPVNQGTLAKALGRKMARTLGRGSERGIDTEDRSLAKALHMLKEMKAAAKTWQEMGERMEREFGVCLEKDQLKALVR